MNFNLYLFGTIKGRYSQYPNDYIASTISIQQQITEGARLTIIRKNDLVHYIFTERIDQNNSIGLCVIFNKARVNRPKKLIEMFQNLLENRIVERGKIIKYDKSGHLSFMVETMTECGAEFEKLHAFVNDEFESNVRQYGIEPLKSVFDGTNTTTTTDQDASDARIIQLTATHNTVIVNIDEDIRHGHIEQIIDSLGQKNDELVKENTSLKEDIEQLAKQKKRRGVVIILFIILLLETVIAIATIAGKNRDIEDRNFRIELLNNSVDDKNNTIASLQEKINSLKSRYSTIIGYSYMVGASPRLEDGGRDNSWIMWLQAKQPVKINYFYTESSSTGYITLALYSENSDLISSYEYYISETKKWTKVSPKGFQINEPGYYYLRISKPNGHSLRYHSSNDEEYSRYNVGALQITGCCGFDSRNDAGNKNKHSYYQYFYNINYSILDLQNEKEQYNEEVPASDDY